MTPGREFWNSGREETGIYSILDGKRGKENGSVQCHKGVASPHLLKEELVSIILALINLNKTTVSLFPSVILSIKEDKLKMEGKVQKMILLNNIQALMLSLA